MIRIPRWIVDYIDEHLEWRGVEESAMLRLPNGIWVEVDDENHAERVMLDYYEMSERSSE